MTGFNQTLHIFRKDVRHLYPEITVSVCLVALFAWIAPAGWPGYMTKLPYPGVQFGAPQMIGTLLHALVPLSWLILISRVVHDESLVGDKQFWVTRPYTWYSLLAAKLLFIASFLCLPLLAAQIFLVHYAGLSVAATLPGLLLNLGGIILFFLLPFTVLASLTSSFGPLILLVLGGLLYLGVASLLTTWLMGNRVMPPYVAETWLVLLGVIPAGILLFQYIRRKTGLSQLLILATPVVFCGVMLLAPAKMLFAHVYPESPAMPAKVDLDPLKQQPTGGALFEVGSNMVMNLPIEVTGVTGMLEGNALRAELTAADGFHWSSPWQNVGIALKNGPSRIDVQIPASVVQRIGNETLTIRLSLAVTRLEPDSPVSFAIDEGDHAIPGGGVCSLAGEGGFTTPVCRYALHSPLSFVETEAGDELCPLDANAPTPPARMARATLGKHLNIFSFDPVLAEGMRLEMGEDPTGRPRMHPVCRGARTQITSTHEAGEEQIHVEQTGIELTPYLRHKASFGPQPIKR